ncbi:MAG: DUF1326 domain-containing protein [Vicinamibacterales bacterium]
MTSPQSAPPRPPGWWAKGLLFENCTCQLVCPGHMHFDQLCTYDRCRGYWAFSFESGQVGAVDLSGARAVIAFDSPRRMIDGGWTQVHIFDESATDAARTAMDAMFRGELGGPWAVLARFVATRLPVRVARIDMDLAPMRKQIDIAGVLASTVTAIKGRDRSTPVVFENIFNQIHASTQVIARGDARYDDGVLSFETHGSHGLWSEFSWAVSSAS